MWTTTTPVELSPKAGAIAAPIAVRPSAAEAIPEALNAGVTGYVSASRLLKIIAELDV